MQINNLVNQYFKENQSMVDHIQKENIKYITICYILNESQFIIYHMTYYYDEPTMIDLEHLKSELEIDEDFKLEPDILNELQYYTICVEDFITKGD